MLYSISVEQHQYRTWSVQMVPFLLSASVHMRPVRYLSPVLNQCEHISCFYQLSMRRMKHSKWCQTTDDQLSLLFEVVIDYEAQEASDILFTL